MREHLRLALLSLLVFVGAFALGGCEDNDEEKAIDTGVLIIDDDRTTGLPMTVFIALGTEPPGTIIINAGHSIILDLTPGTYTVTFDDDGFSGTGTGSTDTQKTGVQVQIDKITNIEYRDKGNASIGGPALQANG